MDQPTLLMAVALHAAAQHRPFQHVKGGKQRGRAMAHIVVGSCRNPPRCKGQAGLGALQRLSLGLLVHREHDRMGGRIDVKPHHVP